MIANVGGIYVDLKTTEQEGKVYTPVPRDIQKNAVAFLNKQLFETPTWLVNKDILDKVSAPAATDRLTQMQDDALGNLLSLSRISRMIGSDMRDNSKAYRLDEYMDDLKKGIWSELAAGKTIDIYRRNLQKAFVERLGNIVNPGAPPTITGLPPGVSVSILSDNKKNDLISVAKGTLRALRGEVNAAVGKTADRMSKYHLQDIAERINNILNPK